MAATEEVGARLKLHDRRQFQQDAQGAARDIKNIGDSADKADQSGRRMGSGMGLAKAGIGGLTSAAKVGITAVAGLTAGVGALGVKTVGLAMDAAETQSKFNTVFAGMEEQVGGFVKQVNADYGIPTKELQDAASTFGIFAKAAGVPKDALAEFSTSLVSAGLDLSSFYNADPGETFQALRSGLAGEAEPLRKFGIFLSDAAMKAEAATMGLTGELTEQQKVMVRQSIIMKGLGDAAGDQARTAGSLANQWKGLKGRLTEAGTAIGTALIPYATELTGVLNTQLQPAVAWLQSNLPGMVEGAATAIKSAGMRAADAWNMGATFGDTAAAFTGMPEMVEPVNRVADALGDLWTIVRDGIVPAFVTVSGSLPSVIQPLKVLDGILDFLANNAEALHPILVGLVGAWTLWQAAVIANNIVLGVSTVRTKAQTAATVIGTGVTKGVAIATGLWTAAQWLLNAALTANPIGLVIVAIGLLVGALVLAWNKSETFRAVVTGAFNAVKGAAVTAKDGIVSAFNSVVSFFSGLPGRISGAARGMFDGVKNAFRGAINYVIDKWNGLSFSLPSVNIPGLGKVGGATLSTPNIPRLHTGGTTTTGGAAIIQPNEELVVLPPAASVVPLDNRPAVAAATGRSGPITLQVVLDRRVLAEAVYDHTGDKVARR